MNINSIEKDPPLILVVDDDRFTRIQLRHAMEQAGYQVIEASDGEEGLEIYKKLHPDIVLLDAMMPAMDGFTLCQHLHRIYQTSSIKGNGNSQQEIHYTSRTPVLMITALEDRESVDRAFEVGAIDYITKPIHWAVLRQRVRRLLEESRATEALRQSEERFRTIVDTAKEGIWVLDASANTTYVNQRMSEMLGYTVNEMLHRPMFDFMDEVACIEARHNFERRKEGFNEQHDFRFMRQDGSDLWTIVSTTAMLDKQGEFIGALAMITDITERKHTEQKILEQARLLDIATDAIIVQNLADKIVYWNQGAERIYGWKAAEAIGQNINVLISSNSSTELVFAQKAIFEKDEWQGELFQIDKNNKEVIVESRWTLVRDLQQNPTSILIVNTNITQKKQLEDQFLRTQRLESIGTLASGIAHDLNNLLAPILLSIHLLNKNLHDEQSHKILATLDTNTKRAADLVKQVLSFSRGLEGKHSLIQIRYLMLEIKQIVQETFPKYIKINCNLPTTDLWNVYGDATQLHQVLMNLCVNARDAMPEGGSLTISVENLLIDENFAQMYIDAKVGAYIVITVTDTGTGISPEILDKIFEPFFTTKEIGKGTGLGLSTARGIIKGHRGFVNVDSRIGKGTQFKVYLPAIQGSQINQTQPKNSLSLKANGELILVVDDETAICEITKTSLEAFGYRVMTANDGVEALALYAQYKDEIGAVLLDMMMPSMDGLTTLRMIEKINPNAKIIAVSGLSFDERAREVSKTVVKGFLQKPYTSEQLLLALRSAIAGRLQGE